MRGPSLALCVVVAGCSESPTPMPPDPDPPDPVSTDCDVGQTVAAGESCTLGRRRALRGGPRGARLPRGRRGQHGFDLLLEHAGPGSGTRSPGSSTSVNRNRNRADPAGALGADRILLEDVPRALADIIDVPLMAVATVTGTGLPDGVPFDPDRFRDEA